MGDTTDGAHGDGLAPRRLIPLEERLGQVRALLTLRGYAQLRKG